MCSRRWIAPMFKQYYKVSLIKNFAFIWHGFCKRILHSLYKLQSTRWHQQVKVGHHWVGVFKLFSKASSTATFGFLQWSDINICIFFANQFHAKIRILHKVSYWNVFPANKTAFSLGYLLSCKFKIAFTVYWSGTSCSRYNFGFVFINFWVKLQKRKEIISNFFL